MVRAVHKFDFRLVINKTNGDQWREGHAVIGTVFDRISVFSPDRRCECYDTVYNCEGQLISLE